MRQMHKLFFSTLFIFLVLAGCNTDELQDLNINPQAVNELDMNYMFSAAQLSIASNGFSGDNRYIDWRTNIGLAGGAIQQLTTDGSISSNGNYYTHNEETSAAPWDFSYTDQLKNLAEVLRQTGAGGFQEGQKLNLRQAAKILQAWTYARLVDFYGNIPYFNANQGLSGKFFPEYDNAEAIMPDILAQLAEAVDSLSTSYPDEGFSSADMIYQGDISKWKKFGNSVMLRYAMRVSNVAPDLANQYVTRAMQNEGVFESNDDNVWIPMALGPSEWTNQNGISRAFYPGDGGNQSTLGEPFIDFLKGADPNSVADDDPRLMVVSGGILDWTANEVIMLDDDPLNQIGAPPGYYRDEIEVMLGITIDSWDRTFSRINPYMLDDDDPYLIMSYAEVELLMAEALERGIGSGIPGTAEQHYNAGVRAAMQMYEPYFANNEGVTGTVTDAEVDAYLAEYPYGQGGVTGDESALEQIGWQMWAAKFLNWWEAWSDWRRTGYPPLVEYSSNENNVTGGKIPRRLQYPNTEVAANPNFNQASNNNYTSRIWWDTGGN